MTSRIESVPASSATMRSSRRRCRRAAGAPNLKASSRKPNFSCASSSPRPITAKTRFWTSLAVDTDGPAADLVAVADDVVGVGQRAAGVGVEGVEELLLGAGEGVVHGRPGARADGDVAAGDRVASRLEQRRVDDPGEARSVESSIRSPRRPISRRAAPSSARLLLTGPAAKKMQSPGCGADVGGQARALGVGEVLGDRAAELAVLGDQDVGQALGAALLGPVLPGVELLARLAARRRA